MSDLLEAGIRGGAITTFLVLSWILIRDAQSKTIAWAGMLFSVSAATRTLAEPLLMQGGGPWAFLIAPLCIGSTASFWFFSRALFEDAFLWRASLLIVLVSTIAAGILIFLSRILDLSGIGLLFGFIELLFAGSALTVAWNGLGGDLVEPRRRTRFAFVALTSLYITLIATTGLSFYPDPAPEVVSVINVVGLLIVAIGFALTVVGLRDHEIFEVAEASLHAQLRKPTRPNVEPTEPAEILLLAQVNRLMEWERIYRYEGLTIGSLAARLQVQEYQLRRLINRRLGHKNFNTYLNGWRLAEAKLALSDSSQLQVPISTIALDSGFQSLGPFNRAFKAVEGITPSEYRQRALAS